MANQAPNIHEHEARGKKLRALVRVASRLVDHPDDPVVAGQLAAVLEGWIDTQWASLAMCAGVNPPSKLTASLVVAEFRNRAKGRVVTVPIDGPEYEDRGVTRSDLYHCEARVTDSGVEWLSVEVQRHEGLTYGDAYPLTLTEAQDSRELGPLCEYDHLAIDEAERVDPMVNARIAAKPACNLQKEE